jgi:antitoxin component of MazEF toxin-antitoxin module
MSEIEIRKVQIIENTLYANIPAKYAEILGIVSGDHVSVRLDEKDGSIVIKKAVV